MTPLERRYAETWPDGTFGGPIPDRPPDRHQSRRPITPEEAALNRARLEAALDEKPERHLRAVPPAA